MRTKSVVVGVVLAWCGLLTMIPSTGYGEESSVDGQQAKPSVRIVDENEPGSLGSVTIDTAHFSHALRVESTTTTTASSVKIRASIVEDPSDGKAVINLNDKGAEIDLDSIPGQDSRLLNITAELPVPGSYKLELTMTHDGGPRQVFELEVVRSAPALELVGATGNAISREADIADFETQFVLRNTTKVPAEQVEVSVPFLIGPNGEPVAVSIQGSERSDTLGTLDGFDAMAFKLGAQMIDKGMYSGTLEVAYLGGSDTYTITIDRNAPTLELVGAKGNALSLEADTADFETQLVLRTTTKVPAEQLKVLIPSLTGPDGEPLAVNVGGGGDTSDTLGTLDGLDALAFRLGARLIESGKYTGSLEVAYLGGRDSYAIAIERKLTAATLSASVAAAGAATIGDEASASLHLGLRETEGRTVRIQQPAISDLTQKSGEKAKVAAQYRKARFFDADGEPIQKWPIVLDPNGTYDLRLEIGGISSPGHFDGKVIIPAVDRAAIETTVAFDVRRQWFFAASMIAIGVAVSWFLREWVTNLRPRLQGLRSILETQQRLLDIRDKIAGLRPEEAEIFDHLLQRLALVYENLRTGRVDDANSAKTVISILGNKLELVRKWVNLDHQLSGLQSEKAYRPLQQKLDAVRNYFMNPSPESNAHADASSTLKNLPDEIKAAATGVLDGFIATMQDLEKQLGIGTLASEWQKQVVDQIEAARSALNKDAFVEASKKVDQAQLGAAGLLSEALKTDLGGKVGQKINQTRLKYINKRLQEVASETSGKRAIDAYRKALAEYLKSYSRFVDERFTNLIAQLNNVAGPIAADDEKKIADGKSKLEEERPDLLEIERLINQGKLGEAAASCQEAEASYDDIFKNLKDVLQTTPQFPSAMPMAKGQGGGARALSSARATEIQISLPTPPFPETDKETKRSITKLDWFRKYVDLFFLFTMGLIVTALGIYVLWAGNPTWGSPGDILIAVLWGLGLHSLTTGPTAYKGITDLAGRFGT